MADCAVQSCWDAAEHTHHVRYNPDYTVFLCEKHHREITAINRRTALGIHKKLSDAHRWYLWRRFIDGQLKTTQLERVRAFSRK